VVGRRNRKLKSEQRERKGKVARVLQTKTSSLRGANQIHDRALAYSQQISAIHVSISYIISEKTASYENQIKSPISLLYSSTRPSSSHLFTFFFFKYKKKMNDSAKPNAGKTKLLNPWMLHFQKLALELKCPLWFVNFPSLL